VVEHTTRLTQLGHEVRLIPLACVEPFAKRQKNDAIDAECAAAPRPSMQFAAKKSEQQQAANTRLGGRNTGATLEMSSCPRSKNSGEKQTLVERMEEQSIQRVFAVVTISFVSLTKQFGTREEQCSLCSRIAVMVGRV